MSRREPSWRRYITFWRPAVDRDVDAEIRFHFEERVADLMARGRSEPQARAEAELEFGDREIYRDRIREIDHRIQAHRNRAEWLDVIAADVRVTWRGMKRAPALSAMIVVTLALGIGANGAIFSMLDALFLKAPAGLHEPGDLRRLYGFYKSAPPAPDFTRASFNYAEVADMQAALGNKARLAAYGMSQLTMGTADDAPVVHVSDVVGDYFGVLGVRPFLGRFFSPEELDVRTPHLVAVLSHRFWKRQLGGDSTIVGKTIRLGRRDFTVLGIAPPGFDGVELSGANDLWRSAAARTTATAGRWWEERNGSWLFVVTRLNGLSETEFLHFANNGLHGAVEDRLATQTTLSTGSIIFGRGPTEKSGDSAVALRLAGVTLIVLLIAMANVANLLLTRAMERRREMAVRVALGVSRARLAALLITESAVLALVAGTVALFVATWGASLLRHLLHPGFQWVSGPLDWRLGIFTFGIAIATGLLTGVLPWARAGSLDLLSAMRGGAREGGAHRSRARSTLIIVQAALTVVLLAGAGLFIRSLRAVNSLDLGYDVAGMINVGITSGQRLIPANEMAAGFVAARERIAHIPGVRAAALANVPPMGGLSAERFYLPGRDSMPRNEGGPPTYLAVTPEYFTATGVPMIAGRAFTASDREGAPLVMVVTEATARFIWGRRDPIGACVHISSRTAPCTTVVGVSKNVRRDKVIESTMLQYFLPMAQAPASARVPYTLVVGTTPENTTRIRTEILSIVRQVLPGSRPATATVAENLEWQYRPWRMGATLFTAFGLLALIVAAIGIYSSIAYAVTQRSHELGVRMAIGAQRAEIGRLVVGSGVKTVGAGVVFGVAISLGLSRLVESMLYGTDARDPAVLGGVSAVLLAVAVLAAALPAWRATRLDPVRALRAE
jgi:predicted permease